MKKVGNILVILSILFLIYVAAMDIYDTFFFPKKYGISSEAEKVIGEVDYEKCDNAIIKYITSCKNNVENVKSFIPSMRIEKDKTNPDKAKNPSVK